MSYVSCSPYRVPLAKLAAAQEAVADLAKKAAGTGAKPAAKKPAAKKPAVKKPVKKAVAKKPPVKAKKPARKK